MNSFYGGPRGTGVEIVATVADVAALNNLQNINYGQYVYVQSRNALYRKTQSGYEEALVFSINPDVLNTPIVFSDYDTVAAMTGASEKQYTFDDELIGTDAILFAEAYDSTNNTNYIGLKVPAPQLTLTSTSANLTIEKVEGSTPFNQEFSFTLVNGDNVVSELSDFRDYVVDGQRDIYNPDDDTIISDLTVGARILIYQKHSIINDEDVYRWYYFGPYNGVESVELSNTGELSIVDYNGTTQTFQIKDIASVSLTNDVLSIVYNDNTRTNLSLVYPTALTYDDTTTIISVTNSSGQTAPLSSEINYIKSTFVTEDYHLIVYYSSPTYRTAHKNYSHTYPPESTDPADMTDEWVDYGLIKDESGILIVKNILTSVIATYYSVTAPTRAQIINYLNTFYNSGLAGGKLITVGNADAEKEIYGFDYTEESNTPLGWYYVGMFADAANTSMIIAYDDNTAATQTQMLNSLEVGGIWFVETENPNA